MKTLRTHDPACRGKDLTWAILSLCQKFLNNSAAHPIPFTIRTMFNRGSQFPLAHLIGYLHLRNT